MASLRACRCDALDQQNRQLKSELARAAEERAMAVLRGADAAKRPPQKLLITAAFLLGLIFVLGVIIGYRWAGALMRCHGVESTRAISR